MKLNIQNCRIVDLSLKLKNKQETVKNSVINSDISYQLNLCEDNKKANALMSVSIDEHNDACPLILKLTVGANFVGEFNKEEISDIKVLCANFIYPYLCESVRMVTMMAGYSPLNLPVQHFTEEMFQD